MVRWVVRSITQGGSYELFLVPERERKRETMCVRERQRESVCERERERETERQRDMQTDRQTVCV